RHRARDNAAVRSLLRDPCAARIGARARHRNSALRMAAAAREWPAYRAWAGRRGGRGTPAQARGGLCADRREDWRAAGLHRPSLPERLRLAGAGAKGLSVARDSKDLVVALDIGTSKV